MTLNQALKLLPSLALVLLSGCAATTDDSDETQTREVSSELVYGDVDLSAPVPSVEVISAIDNTITATVKLTGLAPGATATLTYSLGRQATRHPYRSQTEVRTVTLAAGETEITDSVSAACRGTRLPYSWFITGTLTTSAGSFPIQGSRRGVRCM